MNKCTVVNPPDRIGILNIKRLYLHGVEVDTNCPKCDRYLVKKLGANPFSYPSINKPMDVYMVCSTCDNYEFPVRIQINLTVTAVNEEE